MPNELAVCPLHSKLNEVPIDPVSIANIFFNKVRVMRGMLPQDLAVILDAYLLLIA